MYLIKTIRLRKWRGSTIHVKQLRKGTKTRFERKVRLMRTDQELGLTDINVRPRRCRTDTLEPLHKMRDS